MAIVAARRRVVKPAYPIRCRAPALAVLVAVGLSAAAPFSAAAQCNLDVDGSGVAESGTDVIYIARHLSGLTPVPPSFRIARPGIPDDATIRARIEDTRAGLDVDGNGRLEVATDVVYIARRLLRLATVPPSFRRGHPEIPANTVIAAAIDACLPIRFDAEIQPIFTANCAIIACHGRFPQLDLDLSAGRARASLVNQPSSECPAFDRVEPGEPESSYLVFKLRGSGPCFFGTQMPQGSPPLSAADQAKIVRWIAEGAN